MPDSKKLVEELCSHRMDFFDLWNDGMYLSWKWWIILVMTVVPWVVWILIRKKQSTHRLMYAGLFTMIFALAIDMIGVMIDIWAYPVLLFPILPECSPYNLSVLPVVTMLFIQYFPKIKPVYKAIVYAAAGAFIYQPLMVWAGLYLNDEWEHWYSFPILFGLFLFSNWLVTRKRFDPIV